MSLLKDILSLAKHCGYAITEKAVIPGRKPKYSPIPESMHRDVRDLLAGKYANGLYSHQSRGLQLIASGRDLCIATPTASGKSLVYIYGTADILVGNPAARALAVYPAKALIRDQHEKWKDALTPLGMSVGVVDGSVHVHDRAGILSSCNVVLMTPDVVHAWLMSNLDKTAIKSFLSCLSVLILDEAHVYDGVFGTNMAFLMRRLMAVSDVDCIVSSTATIGKPDEFIERLTGRVPVVLDSDDDGSYHSKKTILLAQQVDGDALTSMSCLLGGMKEVSRFLAFGNSRKMVEQLVAVTARASADHDEIEKKENAELEDAPDREAIDNRVGILPYRAGYEAADRKAIQNALSEGILSGVVSTSALELGLDIGEIDVVIMLGAPPSVKSFIQRLGRAGRSRDGYCLLIDDVGMIAKSPGGLRGYLERDPEPEWLYLDNRYIQYVHALCAAIEKGSAEEGCYNVEIFSTLPPQFRRYLENEINPTESVPSDLYPLKQRSQGGPHHEYPLRCGIEKSFSVIEKRGPYQVGLGTLSYSQALREAYPGAIYYYMGKPYRVYRMHYNAGEIHVKKERHWTTKPTLQTMVFPAVPAGILEARRSSGGFVIEAELQVSERVLGFVEKRGPNTIKNEYGKGSPYLQKPLSRFFQTTGVCWYFNERGVDSDRVAYWVMRAFCAVCGIQEKDIGTGMFHLKPSSLWDSKCQGLCIYDAADGSLRLTSQLMERIDEIAAAACIIVKDDTEEAGVEEKMRRLVELIGATKRVKVSEDESAISEDADGEWVEVVAPGERAIIQDGAWTEEITVLACQYTPRGLMYRVEAASEEVNKRLVPVKRVVPINGTVMKKYNLMTGELRDK